MSRFRFPAALALLAMPVPTGPAPVVLLDPPAAAGSMGPNFVTSGDQVLLSWLEPLAAGGRTGEGGMALRYAPFRAGHWGAPRTVASGKTFIANWADFPALAAAPGGWLVAAWPEAAASGDGGGNIEMARAASAEGPWRRIGRVNDDRTRTEHAFVSLVPEADRIRAFWLDGRQIEGESGSMSLRTALVGTRPERSELLDSRVCDCCQTGAAVTSEGPVVVYRDRSADEQRDIAVIRWSAGKWTAPARVARDGWKINGCPVNGPAVAARANAVAVAWFTAEAGRPRVRLAFSTDAGASFGAPVEVDGSRPAGRVGLLVDAEGDALVSWVAEDGGRGAIRLARVSPGGRMGVPVTVARTSLARSSGVPRIARSGEYVLVGWVEASEPFRLRAGAILASGLPGPTAVK